MIALNKVVYECQPVPLCPHNRPAADGSDIDVDLMMGVRRFCALSTHTTVKYEHLPCCRHPRRWPAVRFCQHRGLYRGPWLPFQQAAGCRWNCCRRGPSTAAGVHMRIAGKSTKRTRMGAAESRQGWGPLMLSRRGAIKSAVQKSSGEI
jgi:hypothetical protein